MIGYLKDVMRRMKVGESFEIERLIFEEEYPPMDYNGFHWTPADRFMENQVGSAYGTWRVHQNHERQTYVITKGVEKDKKVWFSPDRRSR